MPTPSRWLVSLMAESDGSFLLSELLPASPIFQVKFALLFGRRWPAILAFGLSNVAGLVVLGVLSNSGLCNSRSAVG